MTMNWIKCHTCNKTLLKIGLFDELAIKCLRCKTINHLSVKNALSECLEHHNPLNKEKYECSKAISINSTKP